MRKINKISWRIYNLYIDSLFFCQVAYKKCGICDIIGKMQLKLRKKKLKGGSATDNICNIILVEVKEMRFCDKLPKLRKNNNYSQEQLADKLNVSRQAVSKWELGSSYPDMDKMIQMCKILNCNLEDLMDDGVLGENVTSPKSNKFNINMYMKDFLNFITRSYNMFCSMKLKEKIKFIFEMLCICGVLAIIGLVLGVILEELILNLFGHSTIGWAFLKVILNFFVIIYGVLGVIIVLHLFKIRYLDYFVTIEDQNVTEKTIEEPVEKKENKYYQEKLREKVIIRDAKHSTYSFFDVLGKVILAMIKVVAVMCAVPVIVTFVLIVGLMMVSIYHISYGIIFAWVAVSFFGMGLGAYVIIEWIYNFVASKKQNLRKIFIISMAGIILAGAGLGLAVGTYLQYEKASDLDKEYFYTETITLEVKDNTAFYYEGFTYIINDSVKGIELEVKSNGIEKFHIQKVYDFEYERYFYYYNIDFWETYSIILNDLKDKKIRNYDNTAYVVITVTMSSETQKLLDENNMKLEQLWEEELIRQEELRILEEARWEEEMKFQEELWVLEEENLRLQEEVWELRQELRYY